MNSNQFLRHLRSLGIEDERKGNSSHITLLNPANGRMSEMPNHGSRKQLGTGLMKKILKDLGL